LQFFEVDKQKQKIVEFVVVNIKIHGVLKKIEQLDYKLEALLEHASRIGSNIQVISEKL